MVKYVLHYFQGIGVRGEVVKLCFEFGKIPYDQVQIPFNDWPHHKPKYPTGSVPILEVDGVTLTDSTAIGRFVAKKVGIAGENDVDAALIDGYVAQLEDLTSAMARKKLLLMIVEGKEAEAVDGIRETMKLFLERIEKHLENKKGCAAQILVGKTTSWADLVLADFIHRMELTVKDLTEPYPSVKKWVDHVHKLPQLKEYFAKRQLPMNI
ncbi:hypothetical protein L596_007599 [Steinernema carpocapsae]|uniref:Uncharacterized protein n=1 Tax=Steinernema carpocapsae TaxID=34508 RepID=A0A4U5PAF3_STECR|nr:hypothetical protein L596_007599 [Steinernema carpocapsae]